MPIALSQNKNELSVEFNVNQTDYNMKSMNNYLKDTVYHFDPFFYGRNQTNTIQTGIKYNLVINYQPFNAVSFGVYTNYKSASIDRLLGYVYHDFDNPSDSIVFKGTNKIDVNALSFGLSSNLYLNKLFRIDQNTSKFIKKLQCSFGIMGGIGKSTFNDRALVYNQFGEYKKLQYKSTDFQGKAELDLGYRFGNDFFIDVGIKGGYQLFKTSAIKNYDGAALVSASLDPNYNNPKPVHLDFSGLYYGIYLKIGK